MKKIICKFFVLVFALLFVACSERDPIDRNRSIFDNDVRIEKTLFDEWLYENFVLQYNINLMYRFQDIESDMRHHLAPARLRHSEVMAQIIQYVWLDAYKEVADVYFMRRLAPRIIHLVGSPAFNNDGTITLGTAEGGLKVTLYMINHIDLDSLDMEFMNRFFFHTMHHEFAHILHQTRPFDEEGFRAISNADYVAGNWIYVSDNEALRKGFMTPYSMMNFFEDFVELYSVFITNTEEEWNRRMAIAATGSPPNAPAGVTGADIINRKMTYLHDYFENVWNINLEHLRDVVLRRSNSVLTKEFLEFSGATLMAPFPVENSHVIGRTGCFFCDNCN